MITSTSFARVVLWLSALAFAGFGLAFALFPAPMAAVIDIQLPTNTARADFVATYGGFELGMAVFLFACTRRVHHVRIGLTASGCALTGFAATRATAILLYGGVRPLLYGVLAVEALGAALCFWASRSAYEPS